MQPSWQSFTWPFYCSRASSPAPTRAPSRPSFGASVSSRPPPSWGGAGGTARQDGTKKGRARGRTAARAKRTEERRSAREPAAVAQREAGVRHDPLQADEGEQRVADV